MTNIEKLISYLYLESEKKEATSHDVIDQIYYRGQADGFMDLLLKLGAEVPRPADVAKKLAPKDLEEEWFE